MNMLPPELHAYICELACADGGPTIRSLNATSRYFHDVSTPYLYHAVSVDSQSRLCALLERLDARPTHLRHIRHLFILDGVNICAPKSPTAAAPVDPGTILRSTLRLITMAAPTLQSFVLSSQSSSGTTLIARIFRTTFPNLRDLTISGFYPFPSTPGKFPRLQRLHLAGNRNPNGLLQMSTLEDACPCLTSLRISDLNLAGSFVIELTEAVNAAETGDVECGAADSLMPARLPSSVKYITIQAGPPPIKGQWIASMKDEVMMTQLEALKTRKVSGRRLLEVQVLDRSPQPLSPETIRTEWLD